MAIASVLWRSLSEGLWVLHDPELQKGRKSVLVVLAPDRGHPEFLKAMEAYNELEDDFSKAGVEILFEDHQGGYLHDKFKIDGDGFFCCFINKEGRMVTCDDKLIMPADVWRMIEHPAHIASDKEIGIRTQYPVNHTPPSSELRERSQEFGPH